MSNSYFQFKQFIVNQEKCAMKVCTDACIFGAYISSEEKNKSNDETRILDIGTGTGLLSLMIAQKVKGNIDAIEIDKNTYEQALDNFKKSLWAQRLFASQADITQFELHRKYDIIVSNPPFFQDSLQSKNEQKNVAKHATSLPYCALASIAFNSLTDHGRFYILLPFKEFEVFEKIAAENELILITKTDIRPKVSSEFFRTIGIFTKKSAEKVTAEKPTIKLLTIKADTGVYTAEIAQLLKDYYLYL